MRFVLLPRIESDTFVSLAFEKKSVVYFCQHGIIRMSTTPVIVTLVAQYLVNLGID